MKKNLNIIAARTSNFKSSFILTAISVPSAEAGKKVIIFTLEDRKDRFATRYLANKTDIDNIRILHNHLSDDEFILLDNHHKNMKELPLEIVEDVGLTIDEIDKYLKNTPNKPDLVIIDYLNKIKTINGNRLETINDYLRRFSELCKEYNFCGIVCCQINRQAQVKDSDDNIQPPGLHHIKESGDIEQIADLVLLLHYKYKYTNDPDHKNIISIDVAKNKDGNGGIFECKLQPEFNRILDLDEIIKPPNFFDGGKDD
jgi:replicative DNA helicase